MLVRACVISVVAFALSSAGAGAVARLRVWVSDPAVRARGDLVLHVSGGAPAGLELQVFEAGGTFGTRVPAGGNDSAVVGVPETQAISVHDGAVPVRIGDWPSGVYVARVTGPAGAHSYAVFVVRPMQLGRARVLVVEPTNTWQAYNRYAGDTWYHNPAVHVVDLARPYLRAGLPPFFRYYDLGFLRWFWHSGERADFVTDGQLGRFASGRQLRHLYRLIVFPGHEEYVTPHAYDLIEHFRDDGGNLVFLSADNFFYRVTYVGDSMLGRTRWRDLGRPEAALVGAQYTGWSEGAFRNRPLVVTNAGAAPWLFAGTGLHDGSRFGNYGIEIDERSPDSPPGTRVLADIPNDFGPGKPAEMTLYHEDGATVFDAGVMNFGGSADWPITAQMLDNLWAHLG